MKKKSNFSILSKHLWCLFMIFTNLACFAAEEEGPEPPPNTPIDSHIWALLALAFLYAFYLFFKNNKAMDKTINN